MLAHSDAFTEAARSGAPSLVKAWVQRQNTTIFGPDGIVLNNASVTFDEFAASRRGLSMKLEDPDGTLRPRFATDAFAPFGNELVLQSGFELPDGSSEFVQLGIFRLTVAGADSTGIITLTGLDRSIVVATALNETPYVIPAGTTLTAAIGDYLDSKYPGIPFIPDPSAAGLTLPSTMLYEEGTTSGDPWKNMRDLALTFGRELFVDAFGRAILRPVPIQTGAPYAAVYKPGEFNMASGSSTTYDPSGVFNVVKVIGAGSDLTGTIVGMAEIVDHSDPLFAGVGSVFGRRPYILRSSQIDTQDRADEAAASILIQKRGASETVTLQLVPMAAHEPGDIVAYTSDLEQIDGVFVLSRWQLDAQLRQQMSVATRVLRPTPAPLPALNVQAAAGSASATAVAQTPYASLLARASAALSFGVANMPNRNFGPVLNDWLQGKVVGSGGDYADGDAWVPGGSYRWNPITDNTGYTRAHNAAKPYNNYIRVREIDGPGTVTIEQKPDSGGAAFTDTSHGGALYINTGGSFRWIFDGPMKFQNGAIRIEGSGADRIIWYNTDHSYSTTEWRRQFDAIRAILGVADSGAGATIPDTAPYQGVRDSAYFKGNWQPSAFRFHTNATKCRMIRSTLHDLTDDGDFLGGGCADVDAIGQLIYNVGPSSINGSGPGAWFHNDAFQVAGAVSRVRLLDSTCLLTIELSGEGSGHTVSGLTVDRVSQGLSGIVGMSLDASAGDVFDNTCQFAAGAPTSGRISGHYLRGFSNGMNHTSVGDPDRITGQIADGPHNSYGNFVDYQNPANLHFTYTGVATIHVPTGVTVDGLGVITSANPASVLASTDLAHYVFQQAYGSADLLDALADYGIILD